MAAWKYFDLFHVITITLEEFGGDIDVLYVNSIVPSPAGILSDAWEVIGSIFNALNRREYHRELLENFRVAANELVERLAGKCQSQHILLRKQVDDLLQNVINATDIFQIAQFLRRDEWIGVDLKGRRLGMLNMR